MALSLLSVLFTNQEDTCPRCPDEVISSSFNPPQNVKLMMATFQHIAQYKTHFTLVKNI